VAGSLHGSKRHHAISVMRSLFRHCKKTGTIFRDPAARVRAGRQDYGVILPLQPQEIGGVPRQPGGDRRSAPERVERVAVLDEHLRA